MMRVDVDELNQIVVDRLENQSKISGNIYWTLTFTLALKPMVVQDRVMRIGFKNTKSFSDNAPGLRWQLFYLLFDAARKDVLHATSQAQVPRLVPQRRGTPCIFRDACPCHRWYAPTPLLSPASASDTQKNEFPCRARIAGAFPTPPS